jgi:O-succinylbenzoate synthase
MWPALLKKNSFASPQEFDDSFKFIRGHYFAKSAMSIAAYDIAAQKAGKTLAAYLGGTRQSVHLSRTISIVPTVSEALTVAEEFVQEGFSDLKLKIAPNADYEFATALRKQYPDAPLMVDANAGYSWNVESRHLYQELDRLNLFCIEQPLTWNDLCDHADLQSEIKTAVALDESIDCVHDLEQAIALKSCRLLNIKVPRVGGLTEAKRLYDLSLKNQIGVWVGGMIEGPIGLAAVMAFSTLSGFSLPADYIDSHYLIRDFSTYFESNPYVLKDGHVHPHFSSPGLGLVINYEKLCRDPLVHIVLGPRAA